MEGPLWALHSVFDSACRRLLDVLSRKANLEAGLRSCSQLRPPTSDILIWREENGVEEFLKLVGNYGFPMALSAYLLVRLEPLIRELQKSVTLLTMVVARQSGVELDDIVEFHAKH